MSSITTNCAALLTGAYHFLLIYSFYFINVFFNMVPLCFFFLLIKTQLLFGLPFNFQFQICNSPDAQEQQNNLRHEQNTVQIDKKKKKKIVTGPINMQ